MPEVNVPLAFAAGLLGFLSPCIVPLIPGYLSFVSGVSLSGMAGTTRGEHRARVLSSTLSFVLGFAAIFAALGASASYLGSFILVNRIWLGRAGGIIVVLLGLSVLGILKIPWLSRERRLHLPQGRGGVLGAFPVGMAFAFAWTPCIGPVLAAILTLAATTQRTLDGAVLLLAYALGLGIPFLITAVLMTGAVDALGWVRAHGRAIEVSSGVFLVAMGAALALDLIFRFNTWILRLFPFRPVI